MADNARKRPFPGYFKQLKGLTSDFLEPKSKRKKAYSGGRGFYEVERVITRRKINGKDNYLLKWSRYSYYYLGHLNDQLLQNHGCNRTLTGAKGIPSADGKSKMLTRNDFVSFKFDFAWDQCLDRNGDGVRIKFPVKMRPILSWSPQMLDVYNGELKQVPRMPVKKLTIEFVRQPFSVLNA